MKRITTVSGYAAKIRRLSRRIPVRDKRARRNRLRQIHRAKAGKLRVSAIWRLSRHEHISRREAATIIRRIHAAVPVKRLKRRRLRQGKQLYRETYGRRGKKQVLKGTYYRLGTGRQAARNFRDALSTEIGRNKTVAPAGELTAYRLIGCTNDGKWVSSTNIAIDVPINDSMSALTTLAVQDADSSDEFSLFDDLADYDDIELEDLRQPSGESDVSIFSSVDVQFIYAG